MEKASLVELHLKRDFDYSLVLDWDPGDSPLGTFLFDARSGHCEYFASSMAIMLRTIGIPTRMVNGFLTGEYNPVGKSYAVRQSDAHSWVEVWLPGWGWVDFDPTPPDPNEGELSLATLMSHYMDALDLFWNSYVLTYDTDTQLQLFRSAQDMALAFQQELRSRSNQWVAGGQAMSDRLSVSVTRLVESGSFWTLLVVLGAGVLAVRKRSTLAVYWKIWNLGRGRGTVDSDVVGAMFYRAAALAQRQAGKRGSHQTWREWVGQVPDEHRRWLLSGALRTFEKARYGASPVTRDEYARLERTIEQLKAVSSWPRLHPR
jgi:hypothetical protein